MRGISPRASSALPIRLLRIRAMPLRRSIWSRPRPLFQETRGRIAPERSCWQRIDPISGGGWIAGSPPLDHADYDVCLRPARWQFVRGQGRGGNRVGLASREGNSRKKVSSQRFIIDRSRPFHGSCGIR